MSHGCHYLMPTMQSEVGRMSKRQNYVFEICVCCQGQPFYYYRKTLIGGLLEYAYQYLKKNKYGTMNFTLRQKFN